MNHELRSWPRFFEHVWLGMKLFEVCKNDRHFQLHDTVELREWNNQTETYNGRSIKADVGYVLRAENLGFGIEPGYCVLGLFNLVKTPN